MSAWRRIAHERFPDLKQEIDAAENARGLWDELKRAFDIAYAHEETQRIRAIHDYALWMLEETHSREMQQAVVDGFYRPLVQDHWADEDWDRRRPGAELPLYLSDDQLASLYWDHLHSLVPDGRQREFIAELGVGKPPRRG
jgi:hypothetical protein